MWCQQRNSIHEDHSIVSLMPQVNQAVNSCNSQIRSVFVGPSLVVQKYAHPDLILDGALARSQDCQEFRGLQTVCKCSNAILPCTRQKSLTKRQQEIVLRGIYTKLPANPSGESSVLGAGNSGLVPKAKKG